MDKRRIILFDTTLRDGEQSPGASLTVNEKLVVANQLARLGIDVIEAGFPIASEGDFEAVKQIAKTIKGVTICGLARANEADIDRCWEAVKYAEKPRIHTFIATSKVHREEKLKKSKEEIIEITRKAVKRAKSYCDDVEFSPEDAARTSLDYMCDVVRAAIESGATTINIPDTVGYAEPPEFADRIRYLFDHVPEANNVIISVHCHNDLGNAVANSLAAVKAGASQIEGCINGIGERAGNAALEEIIMNLVTRKDFFNIEIGVNTREIYKTSRLLSNLTGLEIPRNKPIVGANVFAHEAGIHQHGILQNRETYEIMKPDDVGWTGESLVIGKHSGKHAISALLCEEGFHLTDEQIQQITEKVKELADKQKLVERDDVIALARDVTNQLTEEEQYVKIEEFAVFTGSNMTPTASVKLRVYGEQKIASGTGDGPVDAVSNAIWKVIDPSLKLMEYNLKAITGGTDALADVSIKLSDESDNIYVSRALDEDIIKASVKAIIKGINKALNYKERMLTK
ncbi:MAG: 2-isopropylmalate synthase [Candidatus Marinimicrobia bacterium]|nr:2-isopropylmalate synthase [Candidatus Neomarinimicrobiota bacterium]